MIASVLLLEGSRARHPSFAPYLQARYQLMLAKTGKQALSLVENHRPDILVLDAASMRTSGNRLAHRLRQHSGRTPIIHIKASHSAPEDDGSAADMLLYLPFTYRKLLNRIERFTKAEAQETEQVVYAAFELDVAHGRLKTPQGEQKLTPKLTKLMEVFMRHPNQLVERRQLIQDVWQTDYMGDTRTLDVHIRWLRQAIEQQPSQPQFIKTVRGKGYILTLPDD